MTQTLRLGSPALGPSNYYAGFLIISIFMTLYLCRRAKVYWLCLLIQSIALTATLSRGALIAMASAVLILSAVVLVKFAKSVNGLAVISVAIAIFAVAPRIPAIAESLLAQRNESIGTGLAADSRTILWPVALDLWRNHPFTGVGAGGWNAAVALQYRGGAHNVLLQILAETGSFGLLIAVMTFCTVLYLAWGISDPRLRLCVLGALIGAFINCLSEATFEGVVFTWFLGLYLGGVLAICSKERERLDRRMHSNIL